jgi:hypothetical protein
MHGVNLEHATLTKRTNRVRLEAGFAVRYLDRLDALVRGEVRDDRAPQFSRHDAL